MDDNLDGSMNASSDNTDSVTYEEVFTTPVPGLRGVTVSQSLNTILLNVFPYFSIIAGLPGIVANVLIIITYTKMGITNSINTSYTAMAVSDLGCVVTTIWFEILLIPQLSTWEPLPFIPMEILSPTSAYPNMGFAKTTACITAYISLERCLCVASPHKVKLLFTRKLTITVLVFIGIFNIIPASLTASRDKLTWKASRFIPNMTVLGAYRSRTPAAELITKIQYWLYGTIYQWVPLGLTIICSIFLAVHLKAGAKWRNKSIQQSANGDESKAGSSKEERIVKTVLLISVLSIILSTPVSINFILSLVAPQYSPFVWARGVGTILASFATAMTMLNSCINLVIYYRLGTKFRSTFKQLFEPGESGMLKKFKTRDADEMKK